jgi:hypothetical protein
MSVLVCVPTYRDIDSRTAEAAFAICANHPGGASFRTVRAHPIDRCRNLCVEKFLKTSHTHLLFLDSDVVPPANCLEIMLAEGHPLVCGIYPLQLEGEICLSIARQVAPNTYAFLRDAPEEPIEIDAAGMGCCLMGREVLEALSFPWFRFQRRRDGHQTGEDIFFFEKCAAAGIRARVVPEVMCSHHRSVDLLSVWREVRGDERGRMKAEGGRRKGDKVTR